MKYIKKFKSFLCWDNKKKVLFIQAFFYCGVYRLFILKVPFNKLKDKIGTSNAETPETIELKCYSEAKLVSGAVKTAAKYTPWESKCLVQALTAQKLMRKKGIPITMYLGVRKNQDGEMKAHAWTRCGSYYITGGKGDNHYAVVAKFS